MQIRLYDKVLLKNGSLLLFLKYLNREKPIWLMSNMKPVRKQKLLVMMTFNKYYRKPLAEM